MLEGLLVDLVPQNAPFRARDYDWRNSEARYWTSGGDRVFFSRAQTERIQQGHAESTQPGAPRIFFGVQTKDGTPLGFFGVSDMSFHHRTAMLAAHAKHRKREARVGKSGAPEAARL